MLAGSKHLAYPFVRTCVQGLCIIPQRVFVAFVGSPVEQLSHSDQVLDGLVCESVPCKFVMWFFGAGLCHAVMIVLRLH